VLGLAWLAANNMGRHLRHGGVRASVAKLHAQRNFCLSNQSEPQSAAGGLGIRDVGHEILRGPCDYKVCQAPAV
jgi:hypothetical protein